MADELTKVATTKPRRWLWRIGAALLILIISATAFYAFLAWRYYSQSVNIMHNYAAELNAPILNAPEGERAWTHYRQVLLTIEPPKEHETATRPSDPDWPQTAAYLKRNAKGLELARQATKWKVLGFLVHDGDDPADRAWRVFQNPALAELAPATMSENPVVARNSIDGLISLLRIAECLDADTRLAVSEGDGARAVDNWMAIVQLSNQLKEGSSYSQIIAGSICRGALRSIVEQLQGNPNALHDAELTRLGEFLETNLAERQRVVPQTFERLLIADLMQRMFTDDGQGKGYQLSDLDYLRSVADSTADRHWSFTDPIRYMLFRANRRDVRAMNERMLEYFEKTMSTPYWRWDEIDQSVVDEVDAAAWTTYECVMKYGDIIQTRHQGKIQCDDATRAIVAMFRYQRQQKTWPPSLEALVPTFLSALPVDRYDGHPLRYKVAQGQPTLYSIGCDLTDDGGTPASPTNEAAGLFGSADKPGKGDWVFWPLGPNKAEVDRRIKPPRAPEPNDDAEDIAGPDAADHE